MAKKEEKKKLVKKAKVVQKDLSALFDDFEEMFEGAKDNLEQFEAGKKVAAGRIRKYMQEMKKKAQEIRIRVMEIKKEM
jgi:hypothetical protein